MMSSVAGSLWYFLWTVWLLVTFLFISALLATLASNLLDLPDETDPTIATIEKEWFSSVLASFATFLQMYLGAFDHATLIVMPLLNDDKFWYLGVALVVHNFFMMVFLSTLITGLFVEYILKEAEGSDEVNAKEVLSNRSKEHREDTNKT